MAFYNKLSRLVSQRASHSKNSSMSYVKSFSTDATHHRYHKETHSFLEPERYISSWLTPNDPKVSERMLTQLKRDYSKNVKVYRKEYVHEIEMNRVEKQLKDEAKLLAEREANEERRKLKAEEAKVRAKERKIAEEVFRRTMMKERREKLEFWRRMGVKREEEKKDKEKLLCEKSSMWIEPKEQEKMITYALVESISL